MRRISGFTLIEVLVALIVLSLAFGAFFVSLTSINKNQQLIEKKMFAAWSAENIMNQLRTKMITVSKQKNALTNYVTEAQFTFKYLAIRHKTDDKNIDRYEVKIYDDEDNEIINLIGYLNNP